MTNECERVAQPIGRLRHTALLVALLAVAGCGTSGERAGSTGDPMTPDVPSSTVEVATTVRSVLDATGGAATPIEDDVAAVVGEIAMPVGDRFVEGSVEYYEWVGECAELMGVDLVVSVSPPAIFPSGTSSTQRDGQVVEACLSAAEEQAWFVQYPFDGSIAANRLQYQLELEIYECLRANGFPTIDPPSEDAYVSGSVEWSAYAAIGLGAPLYVSPHLDPPPGSAEQLEAQDLCGASLAVLYQDRILNQSS